jgi:hypothetical protein
MQLSQAALLNKTVPRWLRLIDQYLLLLYVHTRKSQILTQLSPGAF